MRQALLEGGPVEGGGKNAPQVRTVADLSAKTRLVCEQLVYGNTIEMAARALDITQRAVYMHIQRACLRAEVPDRAALIAWCKRGGQCRNARMPPPYAMVTVWAADGATRIDVQVQSCLTEIRKRRPEELLREASSLREERWQAKEKAHKAAQDALGRIAEPPEDVEGA